MWDTPWGREQEPSKKPEGLPAGSPLKGMHQRVAQAPQSSVQVKSG